jgi:four helix bundle protein
MLRGHRDLRVYQLAYKLAMEIFNLSKVFPKDERYSLTDQVRRSSRSVAANIAEVLGSGNILICLPVN